MGLFCVASVLPRHSEGSGSDLRNLALREGACRISRARRYIKYFFETAFWSWNRIRKGRLTNAHYEFLYTTHFDLDRAFYAGKRILDIGCGPRGSLEWASEAAECVGLDPLVPTYRMLGIHHHRMKYVGCRSEDMHFDDGYFDVVCSVNSLDHVDDVDRTIEQIIRVIKPGGLFLLLTDIHEEATLCEPSTFGWDIVHRFQPALTLLEERHYEKSFHQMRRIIQDAPPFDHNNSESRHGILSAKFRKPDR